MPSTKPSPTRLLPQQTRLVHASQGLRLRVVTGRLWLTQPNVAQDLFLGSGDCIDLAQDWVVIGADAEPRQDGSCSSPYSAYELQPLVVPKPKLGVVTRVLKSVSWLRSRAARASWGKLPNLPAP